MLTVEQHEARSEGLGGSDIAAALGESPWKTPLDLYLEKVGEAEPEILNSDAVHWGNTLEDTVAEEFTRRTGLKAHRRNQTTIDKSEPWLRANIDRAVVGKFMGERCGLECKTADTWAARDKWGKGALFHGFGDSLEIIEPDDEVPPWYLLQCVQYMAVTDSPRWFLAVLIGGRDYRIYTIERDLELEAAVRAGAHAFWHDHVLAGVPPDPMTRADLETLYPANEVETVDADSELIETWAVLREAQANAKALEIQIDGSKLGYSTVGGLKNRLRAAIGNAGALVDPQSGKTLATWKKSKDSKFFDVDGFKADHPKLYRQFLAPKPGPRMLLVK